MSYEDKIVKELQKLDKPITFDEFKTYLCKKYDWNHNNERIDLIIRYHAFD